jgi:hypothetical protein
VPITVKELVEYISIALSKLCTPTTIRWAFIILAISPYYNLQHVRLYETNISRLLLGAYYCIGIWIILQEVYTEDINDRAMCTASAEGLASGRQRPKQMALKYGNGRGRLRRGVRVLGQREARFRRRVAWAALKEEQGDRRAVRGVLRRSIRTPNLGPGFLLTFAWIFDYPFVIS